jgi:hypothetical protein
MEPGTRVAVIDQTVSGYQFPFFLAEAISFLLRDQSILFPTGRACQFLFWSGHNSLLPNNSLSGLEISFLGQTSVQIS